jgi:hypothetical protein
MLGDLGLLELLAGLAEDRGAGVLELVLIVVDDRLLELFVVLLGSRGGGVGRGSRSRGRDRGGNRSRDILGVDRSRSQKSEEDSQDSKRDTHLGN